MAHIKASLSPVQSRRRPQLGVSGQQTHTNICVEWRSATSHSVPPRCLLSYGPTRSCNCSSPTSHTHMHTDTETPHIFQYRIQTVMTVCSPPPPFFFSFLFCFVLVAPEQLLSPADFQVSIYWMWFNCVAGKICLKSLTFCITIGAIDRHAHPAVRCQVAFSERCVSSFYACLLCI